MEPETDRRIRAASAEGRLSAYPSICVLAFTYNQGLWGKIGKTSGQNEFPLLEGGGGWYHP